MLESLTRSSEKSGLPPGTLVHVGEPQVERARITVFTDTAEGCQSFSLASADEIARFVDQPEMTWLCVEGLHQVEIIEAIGGSLAIHPLVLEDILNTHQRPKFEDHDAYLYFVLKSLRFDAEQVRIEPSQISLLIFGTLVITFTEGDADPFEPVRKRLRAANHNGIIRRSGADYLAYALLDAVIDGYFLFLDDLDEFINALEDELLSRPTPETLSSIQRLWREIITLRRTGSPLREALGSLLRCDSPLIREPTQPYLRDLYDHAIRITELIESEREVVTGLLDIYLSSVSNKMNQVMKVLTIFATTFIPLTFLAGVYGMNFKHMPELEWEWAYPFLWLVFLLVGGGFILFFKKKGWFEGW